MYSSHFYYGSSITIQQQKYNKKAAKNSTTAKNGMPGRERITRFVLSKTAWRGICTDSIIRQKGPAEKHLLFRRTLPEQEMRLLQNGALDRKAKRRPVVPNAGRPVEEPEFAAQPRGGKRPVVRFHLLAQAQPEGMRLAVSF